MRNRKYVSDNAVLINTSELQKLSGLGRDSAVKLGIAAGARVEIGRLVYWNKKKVLEKIDEISE